MVGRHVEHVRLRRVGGRLLILAAERCGAHVLGVVVGALVARCVAADHLGHATRHLHLGRPVDRRIVFFGFEQLAVCAVQHVGEAVAVEMHQRLGGRAMHWHVGEDHFVDAVIVPLVVRGHLIDPLRHAGIEVAGEDRHRPFVVARALRRVPGAGGLPEP